jgi:anthranilate synthase/aminodeoxychorismate synthase-like glutamine amidotransferase
MVLIIDNYDSFTYNIVQYIGRYYQKIKVVRNDQITLDEISDLNPKAIVISPGPKTPNDAGISCSVIINFYQKIPILGVCLGHQAIGQVFGGKVVRAKEIMHGKISSVTHDREGIFKNVKNPLNVVRYHSLVIDKNSVPDCLKITSKTKNNIIMAVRHIEYPLLEGIQFHPESIKTDDGYKIIKNFLKQSKVI